MKYLVNSISFNMFSISSNTVGVGLYVEELNTEEFCRELRSEFINAIGHQATADLLATLCGISIKANRINITLNDKDELLLIQVTERLPEGKVLTLDEIKQLLENNKIKFYKLRVRYAKKVKCESHFNNIDFAVDVCPDSITVNFTVYEALVFLGD